MDLGLEGKAALVTGGNRGIGLAVAKALAEEGARLGLLARDAASLAVAAGEIGADAVSLSADTTQDDQVRAMVDRAASIMGRLDIVVNCAAPRSTPGQTTGLDGLNDEDFLRQLDTKALGYARVVRAAAPHLKAAGGGAVVNVSGMNARLTGSITGSVRNTAVVAITKNLADELGQHGIAVTCVHPGLTVTEPAAGDATYAEQAADNSLGRPVTAEEVADVITFLASPRSRIANGSVITLDGGHPGPIWS